MLPFSAFLTIKGYDSATVAQLAEQLICNQRVGGSIPFGGSTERFPSGQREQTVNLPAQPSEVRILPSPPAKFAAQILQLKGESYKLRVKRRGVKNKNFQLITFHFYLFYVRE